MDVNPSEEYKSMVLAGHRPDIIVEVCSRAISFWNFQMQQEKLYRVKFAILQKWKNGLERIFKRLILARAISKQLG